MKKVLTILALIGFVQLGHAQEEKKGSDTTRFKIGSMQFIIIESDTMVVNDKNESNSEKKKKNMKKNYLKK